MEKNFDIMKPCYSEQILLVPWPFVISRFHCKCFDNITSIHVFALLTKHVVRITVCWPSSFKYLLRTKTSYYLALPTF